jgi:hypothetical protein
MALQSSAEVMNKWSYAATSYTSPWRKKGKFDLFLPPAWLGYVMVLMKLSFQLQHFHKWKCYLSQRTAVYITHYTVYRKTHWRPRGYRLLHRSNAVTMVTYSFHVPTKLEAVCVFVSVQTHSFFQCFNNADQNRQGWRTTKDNRWDLRSSGALRSVG